ncbi:SpvB/TcaC N-terminal domain-containing protein [Methylococcus sp. ANG]|uniref:SpvB/TcaC N-terminal domain-containing protein n=1 Tax=Methylococcus sp. ANG TaxID=3231903 RepID=UPI00345A1A4B
MKAADPQRSPGTSDQASPLSADAHTPTIQLPKGGGAIRGIGEKFAANPVTGTGSMSVPIATSPGRSGFGPQLSLTYDSGAGNGPFGFGWSLSLPSITRKTDKGLPQYLDAVDSDVFILSGAEDLVPVYRQDPDGTWIAGHPGFQRDADGFWVRDPAGQLIIYEDNIDGYRVRRYRPRIEGLIARIERWTKIATGETHWRSITRDNVTTVYGKDNNSRIFDPADPSPANPTRIFSWLICESYDDKGNAIVYEYAKENADKVDLSQANERNRVRTANRYLKRIKYGNRVSRLVQPDLNTAAWMFEVIFDYDEAHYEEVDLDPARPEAEQHRFVRVSPLAEGSWAVRPDPFSSHRVGFEVRTYRRCRRVLMFHHIPDLPTGEKGYEGLVRSTEFDYADLDYTQPVTIEDELAHQGSTRFASFIRRITQSGYVRDDTQPMVIGNGVSYATYLKKSLPPLEFEYSKAAIQDQVQEVDAASLENLPAGLDGSTYQWVDLHGEGITGILTEQAGAWFYKRNISPISERPVEFAPLQRVAIKPNLSVAGGQAQFMDLAGDGQPDLVVLDDPTPGLYEHDGKEGWQPFRPFTARLNRDTRDPNLKFIDLDGDGHADVLITEQDVFTWHPSLAEEGFGPAQRVRQVLDEESGPRLVFADGTQSIYLADMCGDGLTDLVRIRNGEVCYWPNLGYGRFGAKVTMDNAPWFDNPDQFDQRRVRLADIDGSGTNDVIYLRGDGARIYFNQSGNRLTEARRLDHFPHIDNVSSVMTADLLGNGTACLVWSSPLPADARRPLRYIDLMGGIKPHLLVRSVNNLGAETEVHYAPSTYFYLKDKRDDRPWVTRLPFPVHVVERVTTHDRISGNRFVTRYAYHHGYFDGTEREFRGFGMVEQWDTEEFAVLAGGQALAATNIDASSHVPPVLTRTWFHTGAYLGRDHVSDFFAGLLDASDVGEYYREPGLSDVQARALLLNDTVLPEGLTAEEEREACRALKGSMLRQEVYAQDGTAEAEHPYTVTEQNFTVRVLQPRGSNRHGVFFTHARESISYHYERNPADPRIGHALTLEVDEYGNVLKSAAIGYGRRQPDPNLAPADQAKQAQILITWTENRVTNAVDTADDHRTPLPCESRTYELTGLTLPPGRSRFTFDEVLEAGATAIARTYEYKVNPAFAVVEKRLIEHVRTYYRRNNLSGSLPLGELQSLALPFESYKLAFTPGLVAEVYGGRATVAMLANEGRYVHTEGDANWWIPSGQIFYSPDPAHTAAQEVLYARQHFFLPHRYRDPFHTNAVSTESFVTYDTHDLLVEETRDALDNRVTVGERNADPTQPLVRRAQDYRVLQPALVMDPNRNRSAVAFDALGMVVGTAVMGKPAPAAVEGDSLNGFAADLTQAEIDQFLANPKGPMAAMLLADAATRVVYDLAAYWREPDPAMKPPAVAATLARETHVSDLPAGQQTKIQVSLSYSDGFGREIQKKIQTEPGPAPQRDANGKIIVGADGQPVMTANDVSPRWVGSGWTVFNNKGKPVRQYEPFFTDTHRFEFDVKIGVSPVLFYDPVERVVATLHPNHTWEKVVFDPWRQETWDVNDTILIADPKTDADVGDFFSRLSNADYLPTWHALRTDAAHATAFAARYPDITDRTNETRAAEKTRVHAATPTVAHADSLGRTFLTVAHNKAKYSDTPAADPPVEEFHATRIVLDIEGNQREVIDAKDRVVMRYDYDMLGNRVHQASMEAGERWMLNDVAGKPLYAWDSRDHRFRTAYDRLRRPTDSFLSEGGGVEMVVGRSIYGEGRPNPEDNNLRGKVVELNDQAGIVTSDRYDFKGNLLESRRRLAQEYKTTLDWFGAVPLEPETYTSRTRYDALNRPIQLIAPHSDQPGAMVNVIQPGYNDANLLEQVDAWLNQGAEPGNLLDPATANLHAVTDIDYDAKGQRLLIDYGNGARTTHTYDPLTFRLTHLLTRRNAAGFPGDCPQPPPAGWPGCQVQNLHYAYDPAGNITHIRDDAQQTVYFKNTRVEPSAEYSYDAIYRLIEATGREHLGQVGGAPIPHSYNDASRVGLLHPGDGNAMGRYLERYVYDAVGNFLSMQHRGSDPVHPGWTRTYAYNETSLLEPGKRSNRLTSTTIGATTETYSTVGDGYDAHGSMLRMPQLQVMQWDFKDQLQMTQRQAVNAADADGVARDGERTWYVYDSTGQRVRKVTESPNNGGLKDERIYLGGFEIYRKNGANPLVRETLHIMDDKQRIALVETRTQGNDPAPQQLIRYQYGNHLGSASLELDDQAQIVAYEEYTPYGSTSYQAVRSQTETPKRYRYTGKERDEESSFYYHGARYYASWLGRWTSCDPASIGGEEGARVDQPYVYVQNRPLIASDPDGRVIWFIVIAAVVITTATAVSPANAPTSPTSPTYDRVSDAEFAAHTAVTAASMAVGGGTYTALTTRATVRPVLARGAAGLVAGGTGAPASLAVSDIARGQASSPAEYGDRFLTGAAFGAGVSMALPPVARALRGRTTPRGRGGSGRSRPAERSRPAARSRSETRPPDPREIAEARVQARLAGEEASRSGSGGVRINRFGDADSLHARIEVGDSQVTYRVTGISAYDEAAGRMAAPGQSAARAAHREMLRQAARIAQARGQPEFTMIGEQANPNFQAHAARLARTVGDPSSIRVSGSGAGHPNVRVRLRVDAVLDGSSQ